MKHLDRYLLGEMVLPFVGGILLIVVMLVGNTLFPLIEQIVRNGIPPLIVARLIAFNIPILIPLTLPPGVALASAWAVNRLARDSEVTVIRMAGVPLRRLFLPIILVGLLSSVASFLVGDRVVPPAWREFQKTQSQMFAYALQAAPTIAANKVFTFQDYSFHIREIRKDPSGRPDRLLLSGLTIYKNAVTPGGFPTIITAKTADYDRDVWTLHDAYFATLGADGMVSVEATAKTSPLNLTGSAGESVAGRSGHAGPVHDGAIRRSDGRAGADGAGQYDCGVQLLRPPRATVSVPVVRSVRPAAGPALRPCRGLHGHLFKYCDGVGRLEHATFDQDFRHHWQDAAVAGRVVTRTAVRGAGAVFFVEVGVGPLPLVPRSLPC